MIPSMSNDVLTVSQVKTTVHIPEHVWIAAKTVATKRRVSLRQLVLEALEMYLSTGGGAA